MMAETIAAQYLSQTAGASYSHVLPSQLNVRRICRWKFILFIFLVIITRWCSPVTTIYIYTKKTTINLQGGAHQLWLYISLWLHLYNYRYISYTGIGGICTNLAIVLGAPLLAMAAMAGMGIFWLPQRGCTWWLRQCQHLVDGFTLGYSFLYTYIYI